MREEHAAGIMSVCGTLAIYLREGSTMWIVLVLLLVLVHLAFATAIYLDAIKRPRLYVIPIIWFVATVLFGVLTVIAYNTSKQNR